MIGPGLLPRLFPKFAQLAPIGRTYVYGTWTAAQAQATGGFVAWNAYVVDDLNTSGMVTSLLGSQLLVAPVGAVAAQIKSNMQIRQIGGAPAGNYFGHLQLRRGLSGSWETISTGVRVLGSCGAILCSAQAITIPQVTINLEPGWSLRLNYQGPPAYIHYFNDPLRTYLDVTWLGNPD